MHSNPVKQATGFVAFLVKHWIATAVALVVVVLFLSGPIKRLLARVPFLAKYAGGTEA